MVYMHKHRTASESKFQRFHKKAVWSLTSLCSEEEQKSSHFQLLADRNVVTLSVPGGWWRSVSPPLRRGVFKAGWGGADGRCCSGWDERTVKEPQSTNCSGSCKGCALCLRERERQGDLRHQQQNLRNPPPHHHTRTHTCTLPNTNIINRTNTLTDTTRRVSLRKWAQHGPVSLSVAFIFSAQWPPPLSSVSSDPMEKSQIKFCMSAFCLP